MLSWIQHRWTSLWLLFAAYGALCLFLYGFFPLKYSSGKVAHMDDLPNYINGVSIDGQEVYNSGENSVILMVIDGLRYDFATAEYMPFMGELLKNKSGYHYVSVAEPPTVTMPRIKAMMTGSVSTFADVALNFGAPAVRGDSVLRAAAARGRRSVLYGDETWLQLFPGMWTESDGTTAFYVTDYTEVDDNVTRHLDKVLTPDKDNKPTFDFLVLHYLGLDHIGHLEGARSLKIKPKLLEMDEVVKKIYTAMKTWDRTGILLICGDHGMRDAGGHGGSSNAEVLVPIVIIKSDNFKFPDSARAPTVAQVDIAPTVAWLLNVPIPADSTGRILPLLLPKDVRQHLYLLHVLADHNAKQSLPADSEFYQQFKRAESQFAHFLATGQKSAAKIAKDFYEESLKDMAEYLTKSNTEFDLFAIGIAIFMLYILTGALVTVTLFSFQGPQRKTSVFRQPTRAGTLVAFAIIFFVVSTTLLISCFLSETKSLFCSLNPFWPIGFITVSLAITATYFVIKSAIEKTKDLSALRELNAIDYLLILGTLFHSWSFFGTSFIEEEHLTWYFFWNTLMFFILVRTIMVVVVYFTVKWSGATEFQDKLDLENKMSSVGVSIVPQWVLLIALHRYLRTMNQTGDRWLFLPDTADWLNEPENSFYLEGHIFIGTVLTSGVCLWNLRYMNNAKHTHSAFTILATCCIFLYRIATNSLGTRYGFLKTFDPVDIVNFFWVLLLLQFLFELATYLGIFSKCGLTCDDNSKFAYKKPKEKNEDYSYDPMDEPWNAEEVKLKLARSLSHIMFNDMMLIICLLMRPHNIIMVPSIYFTCALTSKCLDHKLLDSRPTKRTEVVDVLSQALVHLWIGMLFYFYQGNSNSLASVDLSAGYVGLRKYNEVEVALRMGLHTYAGPALAGARLFCALTTAPSVSWTQYLQSVWRVVNVFALQRVNQIAIYCVVATVFRNHLFVWTVFSPKLLYDFVAVMFSLQSLSTIANIILLTHVTSWFARYLQSVWRVVNVFALQRVYQIAIYCVVAIVFRYHLLVWTVFSPKLLYDFFAMVFSLQSLSTIGNIILLTHVTTWFPYV